MPIQQRSAKLAKLVSQAALTRSFVNGDVSKLVTKLPGHTVAEAELFRENAYPIEVVGMTLEAFSGMVMDPAPIFLETEERHKPFMDDLTASGVSAARCIHTTVKELMQTGRHIALADYPETPDNITRADVQRQGARPFVTFYTLEQLIDWRVGKVDGIYKLTHLRLFETYDHQEDEFTVTQKYQIRVLDLVELEQGQWRYRVQIWRPSNPAPESNVEGKTYTPKPDDKKDEAVVWAQHGEDVWPMKNRAPVAEIPAIIFGATSLDPNVLDEAPLRKLVTIARSHLNNAALREWALIWCGCPSLILAGEPPTTEDEDGNVIEEPIRLGSSAAIILGEGGSAELLQATKDSVGAITETMKEKEAHMAAAGARMLTDGGSSNISTETALLERVGQFATLGTVATTVAEGYTRLMRLVFDWDQVAYSQDFHVKLNTQYVPETMTPQELEKLMGGVTAGLIPMSVFIARLKSRGLVAEEMTDEDYRNELEQDAAERDLGSLEEPEDPPEDPEDE